MTAVAPPLSFQPTSRIGWSSASAGQNGFATNSEDVGRMFAPGPRKTVQRQNSASSIASTNSSTSTISTASVQTNGTSAASSDAAGWSVRKKPTRGLWPPGKAEPTAGLSTARPQSVSSATSGPSAASAISALHAPLLPSQQMANGATQTNGALRGQTQPETPAILHLLPMNGTFERKTINVPFYPDVLRIGRQTNQKTIPSPLNGYFDSKVLSRQHAEVYADRTGRIYIRDVKSSNGTFVNGQRLSQENKESEPRELREQDVLELGIDIVSEDQKTVVHHKVAAKVEHAGIYGQGNDINFGDLDPSSGAGLIAHNPLKRNGSQSSLNGGRAGSVAATAASMNMNVMQQPQHMRNWLNPITTEHIVRKLNAEMKLAMQQSNDLQRARQCIDSMLGNTVKSPDKDSKQNSEKSRPSPIKSKTDLKAHFSEPPAPPPQQPLPEKPDVARALADPLIQPLLRRSDTARPESANSSPTRSDHSSDILRLCEELKLAKGEISNQTERMKTLESELAQERTARENAEERAQKLERKDSVETNANAQSDGGDGTTEGESAGSATRDFAEMMTTQDSPSDLQAQVERLRASMDEMKQQMEAYRRRAESAETERDETRKTLAELIEQRRTERAEHNDASSPKKGQRLPRSELNANNKVPANGHVVAPKRDSPTSSALLQWAGTEEGKPIDKEQAAAMTRFLSEHDLLPASESWRTQVTHHGTPYVSALSVVILGVAMMTWMNGWTKVER